MPVPIRVRFWPPLALAGLLAAGSAGAQAPSNCTLSELQDPPRQEYTCADGVIIVIGKGGDLGFGGENGTSDLTLDAGAVFVDSPGQPVQIRTPQAIAAVRGTQFAVSVGEGNTAVVVIRGQVGVSSIEGGDEVVLDEGEGVDAIPGQRLEVKNWGAARVARMMGIFGR
ncbi:MAG: FecR domain-containing protein [Sedimentitalea sp.]|nr:FecR domain-containing protein [Sedimentitalea sp.]